MCGLVVAQDNVTLCDKRTQKQGKAQTSAFTDKGDWAELEVTDFVNHQATGALGSHNFFSLLQRPPGMSVLQPHTNDIGDCHCITSKTTLQKHRFARYNEIQIKPDLKSDMSLLDAVLFHPHASPSLWKTLLWTVEEFYHSLATDTWTIMI